MTKRLGESVPTRAPIWISAVSLWFRASRGQEYEKAEPGKNVLERTQSLHGWRKLSRSGNGSPSSRDKCGFQLLKPGVLSVSL